MDCSGARRSALLSAMVLVVCSSRAGAVPSLPEDRCTTYLPAAEQYYHIPSGLLSAIALTESGVNGRPEPWALNLGGEQAIESDYASAARRLRDSDGRPRQDAAIGCMQIHMRYHLANVGAPEWVLKPRNNVWYAAGFLKQLFDQYGSWKSAVAHYNASDSTAQRAYLCRVSASLASTAPRTAAALRMPGNCRGSAGAVRTAGADAFSGRILFGFSTAAPHAAHRQRRDSVVIIRGRTASNDG